MARAFNYIVLLFIVATIVAASGCSSNTANSTQAPATTTPENSATPVETSTTPGETTTSAVTPASGAETPGATERNLQIEQHTAGVTSTVSNGTLTVKVSENTYDLNTDPFSTANKKTNPFNNTGNNNAVVADTGKLKIIPASSSTTNTTGIYIQNGTHISTTERYLQIEQTAQSGYSGSNTSQNSTGNVTVNTTSNMGY